MGSRAPGCFSGADSRSPELLPRSGGRDPRLRRIPGRRKLFRLWTGFQLLSGVLLGFQSMWPLSGQGCWAPFNSNSKRALSAARGGSRFY